MTLEEAIENCELVVAACRMMPNLEGNDESSAKHRQLAEWLKELKERREQDVPDTNVEGMISRTKVIDAEGLDEQIRCEMCRNPMHTNRGCDGNCKYDVNLYKRIMQILCERIRPLPKTIQGGKKSD